MELTGGVFVTLTVVLAVVSLVAGAVVGGMTRRTPAGFAARLLSQVLVTTMVLLGVAAYFNARNQWYVSWGDLAGASDARTDSHSQGGRPTDTFRTTTVPTTTRPSPAAARRTYPPLPVPGSRVQTYQVTGRHSHLTGKVVVLLPDGYGDGAQADRVYPVVVTAHGYPGNPEQWLDAMQGQARVDAAVASRTVSPLVLVSPQLDFPEGRDSECVDAPGGAQVETWLARDVPEFLRRTLRIADERSAWATAGFSAGGYCAALGPVKHPDVYGAGIVLGGYSRPDFNGRSPLTTRAQQAAYDLPAIVRARKPAVAIWAQTSDSDQLSYRSTKALADAAVAPTSVTTLVDHGTGHRTSVWSAHFVEALAWLGRTVPGFSPSARETAAGTAPSAASTSGRPPAPSALPQGIAPRSTPAGFRPVPVEAGRLLRTDLAGKASGVTMPVWVWLPPDYDDPAKARTRFPVLMMFPGGDGAGYTQWYQFGQPALLARGAATGKLSSFVMVMPAMQVSKKLDTECTDLPGQPKVETFFAKDVVGMVRSTFRVLPQPTAWGLGGDSSGSYCAARLAFAHPEVSTTVASLSGYFMIDSNVPSGRTAAARATSPQVIAAGPNPPPVVLRNWVGDDAEERYSQRVYQRFADAAKPPVQVSLGHGHGGHNWKAFQTMLPEVFAWLSARLDKPSST